MGFFPILAALAAASIAPARSQPLPLPDADPALWVINDEDTVIYLFGTFHALDGRSAWFNDEVMTAFAASDELVLETVVPDRARNAEGPVAPPRAHRFHPVTASASFLASTRLAISAGRARGMKVGNGADTILRDAAEAWGKPVVGLESFAFQMGMFGRMPAHPVEAAQPAQTPTGRPAAAPPPGTMEDLSLVMGEMQAAWNRGEPRIFAMMLDHMAANSPEAYHVMFTQRNDDWASWIADRLQKPGTVFVAVGLGHLVGQDSVQSKLAQRNVRSARIN